MTQSGRVAALLCVCASGACTLLVEDNPEFSGTGSASGDTDSEGQTDTGPEDPPSKPTWLVVESIGSSGDADVEPLGPALLLAGGGANVDAAFEWQAGLILGGDIVVLHGGEDPQLNDYLFSTIGGADSVQSVALPPGSSAAWEPWVSWTIEHAEAVLIVGTQPYPLFWDDTPVEDAIISAWERGAVIGGIDAGLSLLGEFAFPNYAGPLSSALALADPYAPSLVLERDYLAFPPLADAVIEPRFASEDRMGRLLALAARVLQDDWSDAVVGLGIDEETAMVIGEDGVGEVYGDGYVYLFRADKAADTCEPQTALEFGPLTVYRLAEGDTATWPGGETAVDGAPVSASAGATVPADPY